MSDDFKYDVFLSHSAKDKKVVRAIAERLRTDGVRVWLDEWEIRAGDNIPSKIEEGLEQSRVLVLCMSANAFGSDWATLESQTFRFRDPLNKELRFIPLRLDKTPPKGSLTLFSYIDWMPSSRKQSYVKLLEACRTPATLITKEEVIVEQVAEKVTQLYYEGASIWGYAFSSNGKHGLYGSNDRTMCLWNVETGRRLRVFEGHTESIYSVAWSPDQRRALSGSNDNTLRLWDVETGQCLRVFEGHTNNVYSVAWSPDQCHALSGSADNSLRLWDVETGRCLRVFEGHTESIYSVAWSPDQRHTLSGSFDTTMRLWDVKTGRCLRIFEGHTNNVYSVAWSSNQRHTLSGSRDHSLRLWDVETGRCLRVFEGHTESIYTVAWSPDQRHALSGDIGGNIRVWNLAEFITESPELKGSDRDLPSEIEQVQYTNAKVLLVGESGSGKTGLSKVLAGEKWEPSDSTVGVWATHWKLPISSDDGVEREIWLWDFGGQADQRLIHQLYMDETALTVLVFDGQKEDLFETLGQWDRDLTRASNQELSKLLVAGRTDAGGLRTASRKQIDDFMQQRGFGAFLETSAKANIGCEELRQAIIDGIRWEKIPWRSSPLLFKRLKEEIIQLKDEGRVLMRFNELRETLQLRLSGEMARFTDAELRAVVTLLAGPGVVWELKFGSWVLLQPERINAYAQAVIQTLREDEHERGCLLEERVLKGELTYHSSVERLGLEDEQFVLLAMHKTLVERGLCLREHTDKGPLLIFPSYYRRERPELEGHPAILVSYRFDGFLDDIYATLVVRLHHTRPFEQAQLWRYAADFKTLTGKQLGVKLTRRSEGAGELEVYFDPAISMEEKIIFSKYVHEHLLQNGKNVTRLRHYVCPHCGTPVGNREVAMRKLEEGKKDIPCVECDDPAKRIPLWDQLEELFASQEMKQRVRELQNESDTVLNNEGEERALVGDVISTVALADQISREFTVSNHGIGMEIEFKSDAGEATGKKLYLLLKSIDSYFRREEGDGFEVFTVISERYAHHLRAQPFPVMLVIRNSEGEVRWMEVRDWLKIATYGGKKVVKQITFKGERFDVMSVRNWRKKILNLP